MLETYARQHQNLNDLGSGVQALIVKLIIDAKNRQFQDAYNQANQPTPRVPVQGTTGIGGPPLQFQGGQAPDPRTILSMIFSKSPDLVNAPMAQDTMKNVMQMGTLEDQAAQAEQRRAEATKPFFAPQGSVPWMRQGTQWQQGTQVPSKPDLQLKGLTENGNLPVSFEPTSNTTIVRNPLGKDEPYNPAKHGNILAITGATTERVANIRGSSYGNIRLYPMLDVKNGNAPIQISANDINLANKNEPGRYIPASASERALTRTALIEDIRGNIQATRQSLQNIPELDANAKTRLAFALKDRDPESAISSLIGGGFLNSLSPEQQDYIQNLRQLAENAMAMRSVLGAGQGSEDLRNAIRETIPNSQTPTKQFGMGQLDKFEQVLNRLERGVPNVKLGGSGGVGQVQEETKTINGKTYVKQNGQWYESQ